MKKLLSMSTDSIMTAVTESLVFIFIFLLDLSESGSYLLSVMAV